MKTILLFAGRFIAIHFVLLLTPAIVDIMLLGFMAFTVVCFAIAGVFSAIFCYGELPGKTASGKNRKTVLYTMMVVLPVCALLFFLVAPFSGKEYNIPVKSFAATEVLTTAFLWKTKFHSEGKKP